MVDQKLKNVDKLASYRHTAQVTTNHTSLPQAIILGLVLQSLKPNCYVIIATLCMACYSLIIGGAQLMDGPP